LGTVSRVPRPAWVLDPHEQSSLEPDLVCHGRYAILRMADAVLPREVFAGILDLTNTLRGPPVAVVSA